MGLTLNIAKMVRAREWLLGGVLIAILVVWIEILLTIASLGARTLAFPVIAIALLIAQFRILGITSSVLARTSREPWRAYAFIALALVFFLVASALIEDPVLPLYFALLAVVLIYPGLKTIRGLTTIGKEVRAVADPTFLNLWLFRGRPTVPPPVLARPRLPQAVPWFALAACCAVLLMALFLIQQLRIVRFGTAGLTWPLVLIAAYFLNPGRRHIKLRAAELKYFDQRAPVLILRSFKDDRLPIERRIYGRLKFSVRPTLEEMTAYEAESLGPSITIGEPGEKLPPLGASREYLLSEDWKTAVSKLIDEADLIIFILGDTDNLFWEFSTTIGKRGKNALLVVVPPLRRHIDMELRWRRFAEANAALLGASFPRQLPREPVVAFFFRGDEPVLIVSRKCGWWGYALGIRLFIGLYRTGLSSVRDVTRHLLAHVPAVLG